jgi:hypothetical protein
MVSESRPNFNGITDILLATPGVARSFASGWTPGDRGYGGSDLSRINWQEEASRVSTGATKLCRRGRAGPTKYRACAYPRAGCLPA